MCFGIRGRHLIEAFNVTCLLTRRSTDNINAPHNVLSSITIFTTGHAVHNDTHYAISYFCTSQSIQHGIIALKLSWWLNHNTFGRKNFQSWWCKNMRESLELFVRQDHKTVELLNCFGERVLVGFFPAVFGDPTFYSQAFYTNGQNQCPNKLDGFKVHKN